MWGQSLSTSANIEKHLARRKCVDQRFYRKKKNQDKIKNQDKMKNQDKIKRDKKQISKFIWILICWIGAVVHISLSIIDYLSYPVVTEIKIRTSDSIEIPAISLCFEYGPITKFDIYEEFDKDEFYFHYNMNSYVWEYLKIEPMSYFMNNMSFSLKNDLFRHLEYFLKYEFFQDYDKCIKFESNWNHIHYSHSYHYEQQMLNIHTYSDRWLNTSWKYIALDVSIHDRHSYPYSTDGAALRYYVNINKTDNSFRFTFDKIVSRYLEAPFSSSCVDYAYHNLSTRGHCIERCIKSNSGHSYLPLVIYKENEYDQNRTLDKMKLAKHSLNTMCRSKCNLACVTNQYFLHLIDRFEDYTHITVALDHRQPETEIKMMPSFTLGTMIIYLAGAISIWLGFSLVNIGQVVPSVSLKVK